MKAKWKVIVPLVVIVALAGILGGHTLMKRQEAKAAELKAQQEAQLKASASPTPTVAPTMPEVTLPPIITPAPKASTKPGGSSAGETVTTEPDGTIVITPDWQEQIEGASKIITPDSQATANIGSGGGDLKLGEDGAFHGDNPPTATPAPIQTPTPTVRSTPAPAGTPPVASTTAPGGLVKPETPETPTDPTPETTPAPDPSQGDQEGGPKPPSYNGRYDGEISPDGLYGWLGGFGWIKLGGSNGGTGGELGGWEGDTHTGLSGHKVGNM